MILKPDMVSGGQVTMALTNPKHMTVEPGAYARLGKNIIELEKKTGASAVIRSGLFEQTMLEALDKVSGDQKLASSLAQQAVTDPGSVDVQDITIAQAKANMSLNITRNVLNRIVQGWRDIINAR
jgi:flagellar hook-basal body complex protein FliE